jgi:hypothetical protein
MRVAEGANAGKPESLPNGRNFAKMEKSPLAEVRGYSQRVRLAAVGAGVAALVIIVAGLAVARVTAAGAVSVRIPAAGARAVVIGGRSPLHGLMLVAFQLAGVVVIAVAYAAGGPGARRAAVPIVAVVMDPLVVPAGIDARTVVREVIVARIASR